MDTSKLNYAGKYSVLNGVELADVNARDAILELNTTVGSIQTALSSITGVTSVEAVVVKDADNKDAIKITVDGKTATVTLPEASLINSATFDDETKVMTIELANGEDIDVDLGELVDTYTGGNTATTETTIVDGEIKVNLKAGGVTRALLSSEVKAELDNLADKSEVYVAKSGVSLNTLKEGNYKVTNATENPLSLGTSGILKATKIDEENFKQVWTTALGEALRVLKISQTGVATNMTVIDENGVSNTYTQPGEVELEHGHTYTLSGSLSGHIVIGDDSASATEDTTLILNGLYVYSDIERAIDYDMHEKKLSIVLASGKVNTLYCTSETLSLSSGAALYSSSNLDISGCGYLGIYTDTGAHGIKADRIRFYDMPHVYIDAYHDAIHGKTNNMEYKEDQYGNETTEILDLKPAVEIKNGYIYIANAKDVIGTDVDSENNAEKNGSIRMFGGTLQVAALRENIFDCKGVKNSIVEGFGSVLAPASYNWSSESIKILETVSGVPSTYTTKIKDAYYYRDDNNDVCLGAVLESTATKDGSGNTVYGETVAHYITEDMTESELTLTGNYVTVFGYVNKKLILSTTQTDIVLKQAYIEGGIEYTYSGKKLNVKVEAAASNADFETILPYENLSSYVVSDDAEAIYSHKNLKINNDRPLYLKGETYSCKSYDLILSSDFDKYFFGDVSATTIHIGADPDKLATAGKSKGHIFMEELDLDYRADKHELGSHADEEGCLNYYANQKGNVYVKNLIMTDQSEATTGRWSVASDKVSVFYIESVTDNNETPYVDGGYTLVSLTNGNYVVPVNQNGYNISGTWYKQTFNIDNYLLKSETPTLTTVSTTDLDALFKGGWIITFVTDDHVTQLDYYKSKAFTSTQKVTETPYCSYDKDLLKKSYYEDAQANFIFYVEDGYVLDTITVTGSYNKPERETNNVAGLAALNGSAYNITKVQSNLTVNIKTKVKPADPDGYLVTFSADNATINAYYKKNWLDEVENVTSMYTNSNGGLESYTKVGGQVNFEVVCEEGYEVKSISPEASDGVTYKNLKIFDDDGIELSGVTAQGHSKFRMTQVAKNLDVVITTGPVEE